MSTERNILAAAMDSREAFDLISRHLESQDLTEPGRVVLEVIDSYYARDPAAESADFETVNGLLQQSVSNPKHRETFNRIMHLVGETEVSGINVALMLIGAKKEALAAKLSNALASGSEDVLSMMDEYADLAAATSLDEDTQKSELLHAPSVRDVIGDAVGGDLIHMYPRSLDERLDGGMFRGQHVLVFARPEMGKTMFLVNLTYGFLQQGLRVLYVGNEEPVSVTTQRMQGRLSDRTTYEVVADPEGTDTILSQKGWDNMYIQQLHPGTTREIERLVDEVRPDVLIVDQIRNIQMKEDNFVRQLEKAATAVRTIGGKYNCLVISVTQAGDSASGKAVLDMGDVDSSNTGIPGAVDVMIGIGATADDELAGRRVLSLPKNKRTGRHDFFPVRANPALSKITSMD